MDEELEALRKQALSAIQALPEDKQVEMWNIIRYFSARKEEPTHEADRSAQED